MFVIMAQVGISAARLGVDSAEVAILSPWTGEVVIPYFERRVLWSPYGPKETDVRTTNRAGVQRGCGLFYSHNISEWRETN